MRKQIHTINENPITVKDEDGSTDGQTWLYINPTRREVDDMFKECDGMRSIRFLLGKDDELVVANGWFWTHDQMFKFLGKPESYYTHYYAVLGFNKMTVGNFTALHTKDGFDLAIARIKEIMPKLIQLGIINNKTVLQDWGEHSGEVLGDLI